eukprot:67493_1
MEPDEKKESFMGINIDTLPEYHEQRTLNNVKNQYHTHNIVNVLGGIDTILTDYINITKQSNNNISLNEHQIQQIYQIISNTDTLLTNTTNINENNSKLDVVYYFDQTNNFLYSLFGYTIADKIEYIWYNTYIVAVLMISSAIWYGVNVSFPKVNSSSSYFFAEIAFASIIYIYMLLVMLSVNKTAFYGTIKTFDFYIKSYYIIAVTIALNLYWKSINEYKNVKLIDNLQRTVMVLLIMTFSIVDGLNISWKKLTALGI